MTIIESCGVPFGGYHPVDADDATETMNDLMDVAFALMQRKKDKVGGSSIMYECAVTKVQTRW